MGGWASKISDWYWGDEHGEGHRDSFGNRAEEPVAVLQSIRIWTRDQDERQFFQLFFSVMDHLPGYQGILRRWEREVQKAELNNGGICDMGTVWQERIGYIKTLHRVKDFVTAKRFSSADRGRLAEWAVKVVKRRRAEYKAAEAKGKADNEHLKVLEEWQSVTNTLQNLL